MVAFRKKIDLNHGTEKETRARQTVAATVTMKPGVAGRMMGMAVSVRFSQRPNGAVMDGCCGGSKTRRRLGVCLAVGSRRLCV